MIKGVSWEVSSAGLDQCVRAWVFGLCGESVRVVAISTRCAI